MSMTITIMVRVVHGLGRQEYSVSIIVFLHTGQVSCRAMGVISLPLSFVMCLHFVLGDDIYPQPVVEIVFQLTLVTLVRVDFFCFVYVLFFIFLSLSLLPSCRVVSIPSLSCFLFSVVFLSLLTAAGRLNRNGFPRKNPGEGRSGENFQPP